MKKIWDKMDLDVKLGLGCFALYMTIYAVADICEWITWILLR